MKKLTAVLLAVMLLIYGVFTTYALAEVAEAVPRAAPMVNLTWVIVTIALAVLDFLLGWIAKVIVPPIKSWLETHTTEKQRGLLWDAVCKLVEAAEQIIRGPGLGERRMAYVKAGLEERGYTVDTDMIEAAVRQMKQNTRIVFADAFGVNRDNGIDPIPLDEDGELDLNIDHWTLDQLKGFFALNGFIDNGFTKREDYINFLTGDTPERTQGTPEPEEPQSAVE